MAPRCRRSCDDDRYRSHGLTWLATGQRIGQMPAVDVAYRHYAVTADYVFHCEDDWEFTASGFIERSLLVLESDPSLLQVWIRALDDTNRHPILDELLFAGPAPYRRWHVDSTQASGGVWHGFSFNPGLRRRKNIESIGSFAALDPHQLAAAA